MNAQEAIRTLEEERARGLATIAGCETREDLEQAEVAVLGRKAPVSNIQRSLGELSPEQRPAVGKLVNEVFEAFRSAIAERNEAIRARAEQALAEEERVDVTLPGRRPRLGSMHPLTATEYEIVDVFTRMGYRVVEGPEVETDWYNFTALNIPPDHPARTEKDTVYLDVPGHDDLLLRTETSAMQIRTMEKQEPPVYVIAPGRVYRQETPDATHTPVFHQVEGLAVDEGLTFADMKGTLLAFARAMFGEETRVRLTPDYFPFVEPGGQVAVSCFLCGGRGCPTDKQTGWIELLGCGMVHPNVLRTVGYDPDRYTGFAFGLGIERVALLLYGVPDIRLFYEGDVRFLEQFAVRS
jgi:phenylalanyl-tRNA synthetase alpha chain